MSSPAETAGREAAVLSAVELGLGSALHAFSVPLAGHALSLNQGMLMARATLSAARRGEAGARTLAARASSIAALLKSLAPAGKKLTPMLAISAQGALFSAATAVLGANTAGVVVGSMVASLWAFAQPVALAYLVFGKSLFVAFGELYARLAEAFAFPRESLVWVAAALVAVKAMLAAAAAVFARLASEAAFEDYRDRLVALGFARRPSRPPVLAKHARSSLASQAASALRDLANPLFLGSLTLTGVFFFVVDAPGVAWVWALARPVAVGYFLFLALRLVRFERLAARSAGLTVALAELSSSSGSRAKADLRERTASAGNKGPARPT